MPTSKLSAILRLLGLLFLAHLLIIMIFGFASKPQPASYAVILGSKVNEDGRPSKRLQYRLEKGLQLMLRGAVDTIIVSGGIGAEGFDEAQVMADYLVERGVPAPRIIQDPNGATTYASAQTYRAIQDRREVMPSVIIVSQYFHLLRSYIAFRRSGCDQVYLAAADYFFEWRNFYSLVREVPALYYYAWRSYPPDSDS